MPKIECKAFQVIHFDRATSLQQVSP